MFYSGNWSQTRVIVNDFMRTTFSLIDDQEIRTVPWCINNSLTTKMATKTVEFNQALMLFMEEVQKYQCPCNKFLKDYKNKYIRFNTWKAIEEKFGLVVP